MRCWDIWFRRKEWEDYYWSKKAEGKREVGK